ncbi:MAG: ribose-phosphate pyrophosphokinase [Acidobacteriia bacterium]|nr:ribose-phosphate pyrophosphokinase [Terriglobia bacterium]
MYDEIKIFTGNANPHLAEEIAKYLKLPLGQCSMKRFADGEINFQIFENVRGADVFIIQPTCRPVDSNLMELLVMLDAFKRSSARRITAVLPYYGYARQDRKDKPRVPISAKLVADLLTTSGADRVLTMDLHAAQIQGFFNIPVDHLYAGPVIIKHFKKRKIPNLMVVSPDTGGVERARSYAKRLECDLAIVDKRREKGQEAEVMNVIGEVSGRNTLIVDDLIDTAGTLVRVAHALKKNGAKRMLACCTHPVFSGDALARIENSEIEEVVVTNSISTEPICRSKKITCLTIGPLLGEGIRSIHQETSISRLFDKKV